MSEYNFSKLDFLATLESPKERIFTQGRLSDLTNNLTSGILDKQIAPFLMQNDLSMYAESDGARVHGVLNAEVSAALPLDKQQRVSLGNLIIFSLERLIWIFLYKPIFKYTI